ncbi:MAG: hypothetical protein K8T25_02530 [Planctomycetia bacterium]|nr:hypothetical protein [Planctomycetia bacterium]
MAHELRRTAAGVVFCGALGLVLIGSWGRAEEPPPALPGGPELGAPGNVPPPPQAAQPQGAPLSGDGAANPAADAQGGEVLTRGPIHEAFAEPYTYNPKPTVVVPRKPPEPINEMPPDVKPEGDRVEWLPGYWSWDDERNDYLWISGLWRKLPPGRRWVPGYWVDDAGGFRWVAGMWAAEQAQELNYQPQPPDSVEQGPNVASPGENYFWVPGVWMYSNNAYRWRTGFWSQGVDGWVWVPAHYSWTPRGVFFVNGYWDFAFHRRGVLFAPVYYRTAFYARPAFVYSPSVVVSLGGVSSNLFVRVGYGQYCFGDFYGDVYFGRGYCPWYMYPRRYCPDPLLTYEVWRHNSRHEGNYIAALEARHQDFLRHPDMRPPRTYLAQQQWGRGVTDARVREAGMMGRPLSEVAARGGNDSRSHFVHVADAQRTEIQRNNQQMRTLVTERRQLERGSGGPGGMGPGGRDVVGRDAAGRDGAGRVGGNAPSSGLRLPAVAARSNTGAGSGGPPNPGDAGAGGTGAGAGRGGATGGSTVGRGVGGRDATGRDAGAGRGGATGGPTGGTGGATGAVGGATGGTGTGAAGATGGRTIGGSTTVPGTGRAGTTGGTRTRDPNDRTRRSDGTDTTDTTPGDSGRGGASDRGSIDRGSRGGAGGGGGGGGGSRGGRERSTRDKSSQVIPPTDGGTRSTEGTATGGSPSLKSALPTVVERNRAEPIRRAVAADDGGRSTHKSVGDPSGARGDASTRDRGANSGSGSARAVTPPRVSTPPGTGSGSASAGGTGGSRGKNGTSDSKLSDPKKDDDSKGSSGRQRGR